MGAFFPGVNAPYVLKRYAFSFNSLFCMWDPTSSTNLLHVLDYPKAQQAGEVNHASIKVHFVFLRFLHEASIHAVKQA
jgi:hypothetical protein